MRNGAIPNADSSQCNVVFASGMRPHIGPTLVQ